MKRNLELIGNINMSYIVERYKYLLVYILGIVIGTVLFNVLRQRFETELISYGKYIFGAIEAGQNGIFDVLCMRIREIIVCIIMVYTPFAKAYGIFLGLKYGIGVALIASMAVACYDSMGIVVFLMSVLPYGIPLAMGIYMLLNILEERKVSVNNIFPLLIIFIVESVFEG